MENKVEYKEFLIVPKVDFGNRPFLIDGKYVSTGFIVTSQGCNVMPGATWFQTIEDAKEGIETLIESGGLTRPTGGAVNSNLFWKLSYKKNAERKAKKVVADPLPTVSRENLLHAVELLNIAESKLTGAAITVRVNVGDEIDSEFTRIIRDVDALTRKLKGVVNGRYFVEMARIS